MEDFLLLVVVVASGGGIWCRQRCREIGRLDENPRQIWKMIK
jgi:hypothetical protein